MTTKNRRKGSITNDIRVALVGRNPTANKQEQKDGETTTDNTLVKDQSLPKPELTKPDGSLEDNRRSRRKASLTDTCDAFIAQMNAVNNTASLDPNQRESVKVQMMRQFGSGRHNDATTATLTAELLSSRGSTRSSGRVHRGGVRSSKRFSQKDRSGKGNKVAPSLDGQLLAEEETDDGEDYSYDDEIFDMGDDDDEPYTLLTSTIVTNLVSLAPLGKIRRNKIHP
jgi:hypothetical protein